MNKKIAKHQQKHGTRSFVTIPHYILESDEFYKLSGNATKLLISLSSQFKGFNNGYLVICWEVMKKRGWKSRDALYRAKKDLVDGGWIVVTRQGGLTKSSLYGVTTYPLSNDVKKKYDSKIKVTGQPLHTWNKRKTVEVPQLVPEAPVN